MIFPKKDIEQRLRQWYLKKVKSPLRRKKTNARTVGGTVFDVQPEVASGEVPQIVVELEDLMKFKVKTSGLIKPGGYRNIEEFIAYTMPRLEQRFNLRHNLRSQASPSKGVIANVN